MILSIRLINFVSFNSEMTYLDIPMMQSPVCPPPLTPCKEHKKEPSPKSTRRKCTTYLEFGTYTLLTKLTPGDNCHG